MPVTCATDNNNTDKKLVPELTTIIQTTIIQTRSKK